MSLIALSKSSSSMTKGGANRMLRREKTTPTISIKTGRSGTSVVTHILTWVGLARRLVTITTRRHIISYVVPTSRDLGRDSPLALHQQTQLPGRPPLLTLGLIDDDGVQQPSPPDLFDQGTSNLPNLGPKDLPQPLSPIDQTFIDEDVERGHGHGTPEWVSSVRGTVFTGFDAEHDFLVGEDGGDGVDSTRQGFTEGDDVGLDTVPIRAEPGEVVGSVLVRRAPRCGFMWVDAAPTHIFPVLAKPV